MFQSPTYPGHSLNANNSKKCTNVIDKYLAVIIEQTIGIHVFHQKGPSKWENEKKAISIRNHYIKIKVRTQNILVKISK